MIEQLISTVTNFIIQTISSWGYVGIAALMAIESAAIPLPSEIIMPFSGFLVYADQFTLFGIAIAGGIGSCFGSAGLYWLALKGGRPLVERYGRYIFISRRDLDLADRFFARYGQLSTFIGRMLPVVRTYISIPAGISKVKFWPFMTWCFLGSFIWSLFLGFLGMKLGENWHILRGKLHGFDTAIVILIAIGVIFWVWRHFRHMRASSS